MTDKYYSNTEQDFCQSIRAGGVQKSRKWLNQCLFLLLALVTVSACNSIAPNQNQPINPHIDISDC